MPRKCPKTASLHYSSVPETATQKVFSSFC